MPRAGAAVVTVCWALLINTSSEYFPVISVLLHGSIDPASTTRLCRWKERWAGRRTGRKTGGCWKRPQVPKSENRLTSAGQSVDCSVYICMTAGKEGEWKTRRGRCQNIRSWCRTGECVCVCVCVCRINNWGIHIRKTVYQRAVAGSGCRNCRRSQWYHVLTHLEASARSHLSALSSTSAFQICCFCLKSTVQLLSWAQQVGCCNRGAAERSHE